MNFFNFLGVFVGLGIFFKIYLKFKSKRCTNKVCLVGKTVIVTGANTGIGYEAALEFAKRGARVILACRNESKASEARDKIIRQSGNENVAYKHINFASLKSVRNFVQDVTENEERLDILVNNAGVGSTKNKLTEDGLQMCMQVNYFGPFLLTILLIDLLKKSTPSRIINVSSLLAKYARLDVNNLNKYVGLQCQYNNTKLCNVLFTMQLAKFLEKSDVTVYSLHPGAVKTDIFDKFTGVTKFVLDFLKATYFKSAEEGAQTTIYTATEQGIERYSGGHFEECSLVTTYSSARDPNLPRTVWESTVGLLKCYEEIRNL